MPEKEQKSADRDDGTAVLMEIGKPAFYHFFVRNRKAYRGAANGVGSGVRVRNLAVE